MKNANKTELTWLYFYQTKQTLSQKLTRDKEGHYMMVKGSILEEDTIITNRYAPNIKAPKYVEQTLKI